MTALLQTMTTDITPPCPADQEEPSELVELLDDGILFPIFHGTRRAVQAHFHQTLARFQPEFLAKFPHVVGVDNDYGFIAGTAIVSFRNDNPYLWIALPKSRHIFIENAIYDHGTAEEKARVPSAKRGFITNSGRFVSRVSAKRIAVAAGQIQGETHSNELYSDDIW